MNREEAEQLAERYNYLTQYPITAEKILADIDLAVSKRRDKAVERLKRFGINTVPDDVQAALDRFQQVYEDSWRTRVRAREVAPPWSVVGPANYKGNADKAHRMERRAFEEIDKKTYTLNKIVGRYAPNKSLDVDTIKEQLEKKKALLEQYKEHNKKVRKEGGDVIPSFSLTNLRGKIKRLEEKLAALEMTAGIGEKEINGFSIYFTDTHLCVYSDFKPEQNIRDWLKRHGFKWSRTETAWVRKISINTIWVYKNTIKYLEELEAQ